MDGYEIWPLRSGLATDIDLMMLIEVVAATMSLFVALTVGGLALNWLLQRLVEASFAKTAKVEAHDLDEQFRRFNGYPE